MARNARFVLNPATLALVATGKVAPVLDWDVQVPPGTPRPQKRDDQGVPLWVLDCLDETDQEAGRASMVGVQVSAPIQPTPVKYRPVEVDAAEASVYVSKQGQLMVSYRATLSAAGKSGSADAGQAVAR